MSFNRRKRRKRRKPKRKRWTERQKPRWFCWRSW